MARALTAAMLAASAAGTVRPGFFYQGEFSTGFLRLWSGYGTLAWNSQSWLGAGELLGIAPIDEVSDVRAAGFSVSLTGEPSNVRSAGLNAVRQGLPGSVWLGLFDAAGALIADPFEAFTGRLDTVEIDEDFKMCRVTVNYESRLADLDRARLRRWTHEDQQLEHAGDLGFEYVPTLQDAKLPWGGSLADASAVAAFNAQLRAVRR